jgi:hypothetical protein
MLAFLRLLIAFAVIVLLLPELPAAAQGVAASGARPATGAGDTSAWSWLIGLLTGMVLMTAARIRWRELPQRLVAFVRAQRHRAGWALVGVCYTCILVFY